MSQDPKAKEYLERVKQFRRNCRSQKSKITFQDYEYYKQMFQGAGLFGYEPTIAHILGI